MEIKRHWKKLHNPDYLGSYSLDVDGKFIEMNIQIESVNNENVNKPDGKKDECIVAKIKGNKPMILNATNCKTLAKLFDSPHVEDWCSKPITICVVKIKAFGDMVEALRIKNVFPVITLQEMNPNHVKWNDAKTAIANKNTTIEAVKKVYSLSAENEKLLLS